MFFTMTRGGNNSFFLPSALKAPGAPGCCFEVLGVLINESHAGRAPAFQECVSYVLSAAFYCSDASRSIVKAMKL